MSMTKTIPYGLVAIIFVLGCEKAIEPSPFFNDLELTYLEEFRKSPKEEDHLWTREIHYKFQKDQYGAFKVLEKIRTGKELGLDNKREPILYPRPKENLTIGPQGIVLEGGAGLNFPDGAPSYLWLPPKYRAKGKDVIPIVRRVQDKTVWEQWEVWPVVFGDSSISSHYYDVGTGILVGAEPANGKLKMVLTKTNLEGLKAFKSDSFVMKFRSCKINCETALY
jgi:hypothetical protein